jgi:hypothetical protein
MDRESPGEGVYREKMGVGLRRGDLVGREEEGCIPGVSEAKLDNLWQNNVYIIIIKSVLLIQQSNYKI